MSIILSKFKKVLFYFNFDFSHIYGNVIFHHLRLTKHQCCSCEFVVYFIGLLAQSNNGFVSFLAFTVLVCTQFFFSHVPGKGIYIRMQIVFLGLFFLFCSVLFLFCSKYIRIFLYFFYNKTPLEEEEKLSTKVGGFIF